MHSRRRNERSLFLSLPVARPSEHNAKLALRERRSDMAKAKKAVPDGHHTITPHLVLDNAAQALEWYKKALGAEEVARMVGPDGKIMHAEIRVGDSLVMLNDEMG